MKTNIRTNPINQAHPRGAVRTIAERWSATCRIGALVASLVLAAAPSAEAADPVLTITSPQITPISIPVGPNLYTITSPQVTLVSIPVGPNLYNVYGEVSMSVTESHDGQTFGSGSVRVVMESAPGDYFLYDGFVTGILWLDLSLGRPDDPYTWTGSFWGENVPCGAIFAITTIAGLGFGEHVYLDAIVPCDSGTPVCGTPVVTISGPSGGSVYPANKPVTLTGTFDSADGPHTAQWIIDGNAMSATVDESTHTVTDTFTFPSPGVYAVQLRVANNCGNSTTADTVADLPAAVVVYDPSAGFVTGGGWINSPAGAFHPALEEFAGVTGKASFGFVSKYQKGKTLPTGETEFQFKAGALNFKSTNYEWLLVSGARAQYKGAGTINGGTGYSFIITAIDGQVNGGGGADKFRIKIWGAGGIVYDNQMNADDSATPSTTLGGGSIVIHK